MDIRMEKTEKAIKNAFLELRSKHPLEKITVKELCRLAQINKSTFYAHYEDIYDLSEKLQMETVQSVLDTIAADPDFTVRDSVALVRALSHAISACQSLIDILFSGKEQGRLVEKLHESIKELVYRECPQFRSDPYKQVLLTYTIYGGYYAFQNIQNFDKQQIISAIESISQTIQPLYGGD